MGSETFTERTALRPATPSDPCIISDLFGLGCDRFATLSFIQYGKKL
jgi:hypothetical protein